MTQTMHEHPINWQAVGEETTARVRDLLRLDTRNPPGNEIRAAQYLRDVFAAEAFLVKLWDRSPSGRPSWPGSKAMDQRLLFC